MPLRNGQKFACESCIRGHRVSTCQHDDRPLKLIPPKGRPVKQCEHCRTARKSKSHHGQCDCGSKKEKKKEEKVDIKTESGCCCHKGETCMCGRNKSLEARLERSLKRPTQTVKSKPCLSSNSSETKLTVFANGHHKPVHRNNNLAHTSGAPYKVPRPHTLHGISQFAKSQKDRDWLDAIPRATDDLYLGSNSKLVSPAISRTNSEESLDEVSSGPFSFDFDSHFANQAGMSRARSGLTLDTVTETSIEGISYCDPARMSYGADDFLSLATSPNFASRFDWPNTSATAFSPSDLPLSSHFDEFGQSISHSGDSTYPQSAPGLTSNSSLSHEGENEINPEYWTDNLAVRHTPSVEERWMTSEVPTLHLAASSLMRNGNDVNRVTESSKISQPRYSSSSSNGTTVNVGGSPTESEHAHGIVIPAGVDGFDDTSDWDSYEYTGTQQSSDVTKDLGWLF